MPVTNYVWDHLNDSYLMETDQNGDPTVVYTQKPSQYGGVISQERGAEIRYYLADSLGSTRTLINETEAATDVYEYDPWGNEVANSGVTDNSFRWIGRSGYYLDDDLIHQYVRSRLYDSRAGRWISRDPRGFIEGPNLVSYVNNRVTMIADPTGMQGCRWPTGIEYIAGRGRFTTLMLRGHTPGIPPKGTPPPPSGVVWTRFALMWVPKAGEINRCCKEIGFVQIARRKSTLFRPGILSPALPDLDWFVDGPIPYDRPFGRADELNLPTTTNPVIGNAIGMGDMPGMEISLSSRLSTSWVIKSTKEFETCVICLKGREGINLHADLAAGSQSIQAYNATVAIYGCVKWSILINRKGGIYVHRSVNGQFQPRYHGLGVPWSKDRIDPTWWTAGFNNLTGIDAQEPSHTFIDVLQKQIEPEPKKLSPPN